MGLPIWRDPDETKSSTSASKPDPTACSRSAIRRRPAGQAGRFLTRVRLSPGSSPHPPQFLRSPLPLSGSHGLREPGRGQERGVPPVSSLLEVADRDARALPAPPLPAAHHVASNDATDEERVARRRFDAHMDTIQAQENELRRNISELRQRNSALARSTDLLRESLAHHPGLLDGSVDSAEPGVELQRFPIPPARNDHGEPDHIFLLNPGEPLHILRSPEPVPRHSRPHSRGGGSRGRNALPTPPLDQSSEEGPSDDLGRVSGPRGRHAHPLSNIWRADSPIDGLGDRNRSPTPGDGWEIMRTTITPDDTLPSAESSFTSTTASQSFNASSGSTQVTEPDVLGINTRFSSSDDTNQSDSASSVDPDDLVCTDEEISISEAFAQDMYTLEMHTSAGRERIAHHERLQAEEGNRFALNPESTRLEIGFRLIDEALRTSEGRSRVFEVRQTDLANAEHYAEILAVSRRVSAGQHRSRPRPRSPRPDLVQYRSPEVVAAAQEARRHVHDYFRRFGADALPRRSTSPPPYEPLNSHPDVTVFTSRDGPEPHPVSQPSDRRQRHASEALMSGDVQDLDSMRRIVERLAARDDVPEEWWMSMGLNLSRTRPRDRSPRRRTEESRDTVRAGRIERGNSRL